MRGHRGKLPSTSREDSSHQKPAAPDPDLALAASSAVRKQTSVVEGAHPGLLRCRSPRRLLRAQVPRGSCPGDPLPIPPNGDGAHLTSLLTASVVAEKVRVGVRPSIRRTMLTTSEDPAYEAGGTTSP